MLIKRPGKVSQPSPNPLNPQKFKNATQPNKLRRFFPLLETTLLGPKFMWRFFEPRVLQKGESCDAWGSPGTDRPGPD